MLRVRTIPLLIGFTLALAVPAAASPLPPGIPGQPRIVVFESFMNPG